MQDPEIFINELGLTLPCAMYPDKKALIDAAHRSYVNYEMYFFSDSLAKAEFDSEPLQHCGTLTEPVTRARFRPTDKSPHLTYNNRPYYFVSDSSLHEFQAMPEMYATASFDMLTTPGH